MSKKMWYNPIVDRLFKPSSHKNKQGEKMITRKAPRHYPPYLVVAVGLFITFILLAIVIPKQPLSRSMLPAQGDQSIPLQKATETLEPSNTVTTAPTATGTPSPTASPTVTQTPTQTASVTPSKTPTEAPHFEADVGPIIVIVGEKDKPQDLDAFLTAAQAKGYEFCTPATLKDKTKPLIVVFDHIPLSGVLTNQTQLIKTMQKYGVGVLAIYTETRRGAGTPFLGDLIQNKGWEFAWQARYYKDMTNASGDVVLDEIAMSQGVAQGHTYRQKTFPNVWYPPFGKTGEGMQNGIGQLNEIMASPRMAAYDGAPGITFVITADLRTSFETKTGAVEVYPSILLKDAKLEEFPY